MPRKTFLVLLLFLVSTCAKRKNVLLIVLDDLRPAIGAYGDKVKRRAQGRGVTKFLACTHCVKNT